MARILLGVSGGISAYKAVELARLATVAGHAVRVVQTPASLSFVGKATFEAITGAPVLTDELEPDRARGAFPGDEAPLHEPIVHLELVRRADVYAIAPASANTIAKLAAGLSDNLLTSSALACSAPLVIAPAMNARMLDHPATRANLALLESRGAVLVPPEIGALASRGEWGAGRLADPATLLAAIERALPAPASYSPGSLDGLRVLVTTGGTREPIDAARYVGNRSSGRMGLALAEEAAERGAEVTVVAANVSLPRPSGVRWIDVETAADLEHATRAAFERADVLIMAAAVADLRPAEPVAGKLSKDDPTTLSLRLERTIDVLSALASERQPGQTVVGFAAEHGEGGLLRAAEKLRRKRLDAVVVNDIAEPGIGFESEDNEVTIITASGSQAVARAPKRDIARTIIAAVEELRAGVTTSAVSEPGCGPS